MDILIKKYFLTYFGNELGARVKDAFVHGGIASIIGRGFPVIGFMMCARILQPEEFGKFMIIYSVILTFITIIEAGLGITIIKYTAQYRMREHKRLSEILSLAQYISFFNLLVFSLAILLFREEISEIAFADPGLEQYLLTAVVVIGMGGLCSIQQAILYGLEKYKKVKVTNFLSGIVLLFALTLGAYFYNIEGALTGLIVAKTLNLIMLSAYTQEFYKASKLPRFGSINVHDIKLLLGFSFPSFLNSLLFGPAILISMSIVAHAYNGFEEIGIYNAAYQWFSLALFLPSILTQTALPIMSEQVNSGKFQQARKLLIKNIWATSILVTPFVVLVMLASPMIMKYYGEAYQDSWLVLVMLMIAAILALPQGLLGNYIVSNNKVWRWLLTSIIWAVTLIMVTYLSVDLGAKGIALGLIVAYFLRALIAICFTKNLHTNRI